MEDQNFPLVEEYNNVKKYYNGLFLNIAYHEEFITSYEISTTRSHYHELIIS